MANHCWRTPPEGWMKVNVDTFRRQYTKFASLDYIMRGEPFEHHYDSSKRVGDCPILVNECLTVREAILMIIQKGI